MTINAPPSCEAIASAIRSAIPHVYREAAESKRHEQNVIDAKQWLDDHADVVRWCDSHTNDPGGWRSDVAGRQLELAW